MIDISHEREIIDSANAILNNGGIVEIKIERDGLTVVEVRRKLKTQRPV